MAPPASTKLCRNGAACQNSNCPYQHPGVGKFTTSSSDKMTAAAVDNKPLHDANSCSSAASTKEPTKKVGKCRFGADCKRINCKFSHPLVESSGTSSNTSKKKSKKSAAEQYGSSRISAAAATADTADDVAPKVRQSISGPPTPATVDETTFDDSEEVEPTLREMWPAMDAKAPVAQTNKTGKPCRFGDNCNYKNCLFTHSGDPPLLAAALKSKSKPPCRHGANCKNKKCKFVHPPEWNDHLGAAIQSTATTNPPLDELQAVWVSDIEKETPNASTAADTSEFQDAMQEERELEPMLKVQERQRLFGYVAADPTRRVQQAEAEPQKVEKERARLEQEKEQQRKVKQKQQQQDEKRRIQEVKAEKERQRAEQERARLEREKEQQLKVKQQQLQQEEEKKHIQEVKAEAERQRFEQERARLDLEKKQQRKSKQQQLEDTQRMQEAKAEEERQRVEKEQALVSLEREKVQQLKAKQQQEEKQRKANEQQKKHTASIGKQQQQSSSHHKQEESVSQQAKSQRPLSQAKNAKSPKQKQQVKQAPTLKPQQPAAVPQQSKHAKLQRLSSQPPSGPSQKIPLLQHAQAAATQQQSPQPLLPHNPPFTVEWLVGLCSKIPSPLGAIYLARSVWDAGSLNCEARQQESLFTVLGPSEEAMNVLVEVMPRLKQIRSSIKASDFRGYQPNKATTDQLDEKDGNSEESTASSKNDMATIIELNPQVAKSITTKVDDKATTASSNNSNGKGQTKFSAPPVDKPSSSVAAVPASTSKGTRSNEADSTKMSAEELAKYQESPNAVKKERKRLEKGLPHTTVPGQNGHASGEQARAVPQTVVPPSSSLRAPMAANVADSADTDMTKMSPEDLAQYKELRNAAKKERRRLEKEARAREEAEREAETSQHAEVEAKAGTQSITVAELQVGKPHDEAAGDAAESIRSANELEKQRDEERKRQIQEELRISRERAAARKASKYDRKQSFHDDLKVKFQERSDFWKAEIAKEIECAEYVVKLCLAEFKRVHKVDSSFLRRDFAAMKKIEAAAHETYRAIYKLEAYSRVVVKGMKQQDLNERTGAIIHWDGGKEAFMVSLDSKKGKSKFDMLVPAGNLEHVPIKSTNKGKVKRHMDPVHMVFIPNLGEGKGIMTEVFKSEIDRMRVTRDIDAYLSELMTRRDREEKELREAEAEMRCQEEEQRRRRAEQRRREEAEANERRRAYEEEKARYAQWRRDERERERREQANYYASRGGFRGKGGRHPAYCRCLQCLLEEELLRHMFGGSRGGGFHFGFGGGFGGFRRGGYQYENADDYFEDDFDQHNAREKEERDAAAAEILGVTVDATESQVKTAYRRLALTYHPDKYSPDRGEMTKDEAMEYFKEINNANDRLMSKFD